MQHLFPGLFRYLHKLHPFPEECKNMLFMFGAAQPAYLGWNSMQGFVWACIILFRISSNNMHLYKRCDRLWPKRVALCKWKLCSTIDVIYIYSLSYVINHQHFGYGRPAHVSKMCVSKLLAPRAAWTASTCLGKLLELSFQNTFWLLGFWWWWWCRALSHATSSNHSVVLHPSVDGVIVILEETTPIRVKRFHLSISAYFATLFII